MEKGEADGFLTPVRRWKRPEKAPIRRSLWINTAMLIIGDVLGCGIIELPGNTRILGWGWTIPLLLIFMSLGYYLGLMVSRVATHFAQALTFGDIAEPVFGRNGYMIAAISQYTYLVLTCGLYVLLASKSLQYMLYDYDLCQPVAGAIVVAAWVLPSQLRNLHEISFIAVLSFIAICGYLIICVQQMSTEGPEPGSKMTTIGVAPDTDYNNFMSACMGIVFAFSGLEVYLEFIAEMRNPADFYKSLRFSFGVIGGVYLAVTSYVYWLYGQDTPTVITAVVKEGMPLRIANAMLLVHLVATYLIKQQVVIRAVQMAVSPHNANSASCSARLQWLLFSCILLAVSWLLANAIPFFTDFCSLLGAFMDTTLCIILPVAIALKASSLSFMKLGIVEIPFLKFILVFGVIFAVCGIVGTCNQLFEHWAEFGSPFSCLTISGVYGEA